MGLTRLEVSNRQVLEASSKESLSHSIRSTVSLRVSTDSLTTRHLPSKTSSDTLSSKDITRNHLQLYKTKTKLGKIFKKCDRKILSSSSSEPWCTRSKIFPSLLKEWIVCQAMRLKSWLSSLKITDLFPMTSSVTMTIEPTRRTCTNSSNIKLTTVKAWLAGAQ